MYGIKSCPSVGILEMTINNALLINCRLNFRSPSHHTPLHPVAIVREVPDWYLDGFFCRVIHEMIALFLQYRWCQGNTSLSSPSNNQFTSNEASIGMSLHRQYQFFGRVYMEQGLQCRAYRAMPCLVYLGFP